MRPGSWGSGAALVRRPPRPPSPAPSSAAVSAFAGRIEARLREAVGAGATRGRGRGRERGAGLDLLGEEARRRGRSGGRRGALRHLPGRPAGGRPPRSSASAEDAVRSPSRVSTRAPSSSGVPVQRPHPCSGSGPRRTTSGRSPTAGGGTAPPPGSHGGRWSRRWWTRGPGVLFTADPTTGDVHTQVASVLWGRARVCERRPRRRHVPDRQERPHDHPRGGGQGGAAGGRRRAAGLRREEVPAELRRASCLDDARITEVRPSRPRPRAAVRPAPGRRGRLGPDRLPVAPPGTAGHDLGGVRRRRATPWSGTTRTSSRATRA